MIWASLYLVAVALAGEARVPTHYPPIVNEITNLTDVFNDELDTNGGHYNGSYVSPEAYGEYNFCNMPHVRKLEYLVPESGFKLQYVEVIHRHHKRTPYQDNTFPEEDTELSCSTVRNMYYSNVLTRGNENVNVGWSNYQDPVNPFAFELPGFNGTCQFPQISDGGLNDSYYHGVDLYANYHTNLNFLPEKYNSSLVQFYVTSNVITSQVAGALIAGMFPLESNENIDVNMQRAISDSLEPKYECDGADATKASIYLEQGWLDHLSDSKFLFEELDLISGVSNTSLSWHTSWDHYFDNLAHRTCHNMALPCSLKSDECISEIQANQVFRLGDFEYNYLYRQSLNSTLYSVARYGVFLMELQQHLKDAKDGSSTIKYRHNIAHDGSVSPLLGALQIEYMRWPGMGAEVVFELWQKPTDETSYVRVLYGGQPLKTSGPLGTIDMVPYEEFNDYLESLVGDGNVVALCAN
ncbi:CIC11C00000000788 [Sungouiella intermedia]|uniref:CIC11C00000000788 n=1 Tax=Sungouiella intermedia TaxID=45354 RepID=A0A1L0C0S2_9ASCO|nr:CIC11C00000000788 [[Candida] intermedia]